MFVVGSAFFKQKMLNRLWQPKHHVLSDETDKSAALSAGAVVAQVCFSKSLAVMRDTLVFKQ